MKTVGIFMAGQAGDIMSAMSVFKYKQELWGKDCRIVWYIEERNADLFSFQDIELRPFPRGFGYPERVIQENTRLIEAGEKPTWEDWAPLVDWDNHMNVALKHHYPSLEDIDIGYFPAPHQMTPQQRHGIEYPNISKKVFGVPDSWPWHPVLEFSLKEVAIAMEFLNNLPYKTVVAIETYGGSGQSILNDGQVRRSMLICEEMLGKCSFIFMSHKYLRVNEKFPIDLLVQEHISTCAHFTVRQCALIVDKCDLLISVSSGITVAASAWGLNAVPIIQYCGSSICSTQAMALGRFELITTDDNPLAESQYYDTLEKLLIEIK